MQKPKSILFFLLLSVCLLPINCLADAGGSVDVSVDSEELRLPGARRFDRVPDNCAIELLDHHLNSEELALCAEYYEGLARSLHERVEVLRAGEFVEGAVVDDASRNSNEMPPALDRFSEGI